MALDPENFGPFAGKINAADANYTYGSARDVTVPGDGTGTPLVEGLLNDTFGMQQALLNEAGIIPNGTPDTVLVSQYLNAIKIVAKAQAFIDTPPIIDGGFNIWPEGLSVVTNPNRVYSGNNFSVTASTIVAGGGVATVSRQNFVNGQTDVPGNPKHFLNFNLTVAPTMGQSRIEHISEDVAKFSGTTVKFNFYAKASAPFNMQINIKQNFGTGGAPSGTVDVVQDTIAVTTAWQKFTVDMTFPSISGKTLGTDKNDYSSVLFRVDSVVVGTFSLDTANWWIGEGDFIAKTMPEIINDCERYFEKSYDIDVAPGTITAANPLLYTAASVTNVQVSYLMSSRKRLPIAIGSIFSSVTGASAMMTENGADVGATLAVINEKIFRPTPAAASLDGGRYEFHYSIDGRAQQA